MALCAGVGGLELGLSLAVPDYRCVCYVEREAYAASILVQRMEEGWLDKAPIWDDLASFRGGAWHGLVDIISAGFPCQPWSDAGKRQGLEDERWIWDDIAKIIREVAPSHVFLENVPGLLRGGPSHVLGDLASLGFDAEWGVFSATGVGAPHLRRRLFILARKVADTEGVGRGDGATEDLRKVGGEGDTPRNSGEVLAHPHSIGGGEVLPTPQRRFSDPDGGCREVEDTDFEGLQEVGQGQGDLQTTRQGGEPPGPGWWEIEPELGRVADGVADRVDRIRAIGNGVVPAVAAKAFTVLRGRLTE